jgi:hypothetical protein
MGADPKDEAEEHDHGRDGDDRQHVGVVPVATPRKPASPKWLGAPRGGYAGTVPGPSVASFDTGVSACPRHNVV